MKRKLLVGLLTVLCMFVFAGCQKSGDAGADNGNSADASKGDGTTIQVLVPGYDGGYLKEQLDECIPKFEKENPDIKVEIVSVGWDELNSKVVQLYQANEAPDIMLLGSRSLKQFSELGVLEELDSYMTPEYVDGRIDNILATGKVDGKQYGIPMAFSSRALFYRSDLIETPPTNWDELLATAQKVHDEKDMYGFAIAGDPTTGTDELLNFIYQGGGRIVDDEGKYVIDSQENIDTFKYLAQFKDIIPDVVSTKRDDQAQMFVNGDLAMFISGSWEIPKLDEGDVEYKIAKLPMGKEDTVNLVTDSYVMSSLSKNKDAAWAFIEFMGQPDQQFLITDAYQWYPVTKAEEERDVYKEENIKPFMEVIPNGHAEPQVPNWDEFDKSIRIAVQKAITGQATPEDALKTAQEELSK